MLSKAQIKTIKSLSVKKYRDELGLFIAEGDKLVEELLHSDFALKHLYITSNSNIKSDKAEIITEPEMQKITGLKTPSVSFAVFKIPKHKLNIKEFKDELTIALDDIQDPGNLGTIIRIADWFGIKHIICSLHTADCYNPKTIQATMGAITRVKLYYIDLAHELASARDEGIPVYGTFLSGNNIYLEKLNSNGIIVMGNEGQGISAEIEKIITNKLFIPPYNAGNTSESLNVATATAITCSEFIRQIKWS